MILVSAVLFFELIQSADAAADDDAAAVGIFFREIDTTVRDGGVRGHQSKLSKTVQPMDFLFVDQRFRVEVFDFAAKVDLECSGVELFDGSDAAFSS